MHADRRGERLRRAAGSSARRSRRRAPARARRGSASRASAVRRAAAPAARSAPCGADARDPQRRQQRRRAARADRRGTARPGARYASRVARRARAPVSSSERRSSTAGPSSSGCATDAGGLEPARARARSSGSVRKNGDRMPIGWHAPSRRRAGSRAASARRCACRRRARRAPRARAPRRRPARARSRPRARSGPSRRRPRRIARGRAIAADAQARARGRARVSSVGVRSRRPRAARSRIGASIVSPSASDAGRGVDDPPAACARPKSGCDSTMTTRSSPSSKPHCAWTASSSCVAVQVAVAEVPAEHHAADHLAVDPLVVVDVVDRARQRLEQRPSLEVHEAVRERHRARDLDAAAGRGSSFASCSRIVPAALRELVELRRRALADEPDVVGPVAGVVAHREQERDPRRARGCRSAGTSDEPEQQERDQERHRRDRRRGSPRGGRRTGTMPP